jgi:hypothetical protein
MSVFGYLQRTAPEIVMDITHFHWVGKQREKHSLRAKALGLSQLASHCQKKREMSDSKRQLVNILKPTFPLEPRFKGGPYEETVTNRFGYSNQRQYCHGSGS